MRKLNWVNCDCCAGRGRTENPAFSNGFTSSEWREMHEEEQANYMAGGYDILCQGCGGLGRVLVANVALLTYIEKRVLAADLRDDREKIRPTVELDAGNTERGLGC